MAEHYSKAPILEAVIDLRVSASVSEDRDILLNLKESLKDVLPVQGDFFEDTAEFLIQQEGSTANVTRDAQGYRLTPEDKSHVLTIKTTGFTFSKLHPYDRWESFCELARTFWAAYRDAWQPRFIDRVAVRYINRIEFPASDSLQTYLNLHPLVPETFPEASHLQGYFMQLQIPQPDIQSMLIVNQAKVEPPNPETVALILDFDVFRESKWEIDKEEEIWQFLGELRNRKNQAFEASITEKTKEIIR